MNENTLNNEVFTSTGQDDSTILLNINDNISNVYNCVLVVTCIVLSFSLYMFFHNITKRKEI